MTSRQSATTDKWPNFYIVGAPKAGTTSLYAYLGAHPGIFLPARKELRYFGRDLEIRHRHRFTRAEFLEEYANASGSAVTGNAFVWYLFSESAAREINDVRPDARIIVMLRDPVEALYSLHSEFVYSGNEDLVEFEAALAAEPDRCAGRRIPAEAHFPAGLCYRRTVRYAEQVGRFLDTFGPGQVHVITFDEFSADPHATYAAVLAFLGVAPDARGEFARLNPNKRSRSAVARRLLAEPPRPIRRLARTAIPRAVRGTLYRRAVALNTRDEHRPGMPDTVRAALRTELAPEVAKVEALLGRPLVSWREDA